METIKIIQTFKHDGDLLALTDIGKVYYWDYDRDKDGYKIYGWKLSDKYPNRVLK